MMMRQTQVRKVTGWQRTDRVTQWCTRGCFVVPLLCVAYEFHDVLSAPVVSQT
jgi:hypothetical protein